MISLLVIGLLNEWHDTLFLKLYELHQPIRLNTLQLGLIEDIKYGLQFYGVQVP